MHACNPRASEMDGGSSEVQDHPGLHRVSGQPGKSVWGRDGGRKSRSSRESRTSEVLSLPDIKPPLSRKIFCRVLIDHLGIKSHTVYPNLHADAPQLKMGLYPKRPTIHRQFHKRKMHVTHPLFQTSTPPSTLQRSLLS